MTGIGIDIGTTTICGVAMDEQKNIKNTVTLANGSAVCGKYGWERLQDVDKIYDICIEVLKRLKACAGETGTIGISGQMHGILYVDKKGRAVSPLFSWQDGRGNEPFEQGKTYSEALSELTGYKMATGYGLTTHYYNLINGLVPNEAVQLCTIGDYIAMKLSGRISPILHKSMAASLGVFDLAAGDFDREALKRAGIETDILPEVGGGERYLREYIADCPAVAMALGDNQASFYGSVGKDSTVLVNIGTGSQVSVYTDKYDPAVDIEYRPYVNGAYLMVGSPLCGGAAYAMLKEFFKETVRLFAGGEPENIYEIMNQAAERAYEDANALLVDTRFCGTRQDPSVRGSVKNIAAGNFTPGAVAVGMLRGISGELYDIYEKIPEIYRRTEVITGSGNGLRQNPVLRRIVSEMFGKELYIPRYKEEASCGAALYAMESGK